MNTGDMETVGIEPTEDSRQPSVGVPFPPNPPEQTIDKLRENGGAAQDWRPDLLVVPLGDAEAAVRAADSWWRSRLVSDDFATELAACYAYARAVLSLPEIRAMKHALTASLLPVNEPEPLTMVVSMWEPWNVGAARDTNEPRETT